MPAELKPHTPGPCMGQCPCRSCLTIAVVQSWDLTQIEATGRTRSPTVLETVDGARAIVIRLAPGQELGDHQVRERAWLTIVEGKHAVERKNRLSSVRN
jgi:hypothetical protein